MRKRRDTNRDQIYEAELSLKEFDQEFKDLQELREYVNELTSDNWWKFNSKIRKVLVRTGRGGRIPRVWYETVKGKLIGYMVVPEHLWNVSYVLHALAHIMVMYYQMLYGDPDHGDLFVSNHMKLVRRYMGMKAYKTFKNSLKELGVDAKLTYKNGNTKKRNYKRVPMD